MTDRKEASTLSESRQAFEEWAEPGWFIERAPLDREHYKDNATHSAWLGWQAALESRLAVGQPVAQVHIEGAMVYVHWLKKMPEGVTDLYAHPENAAAPSGQPVQALNVSQPQETVAAAPDPYLEGIMNHKIPEWAKEAAPDRPQEPQGDLTEPTPRLQRFVESIGIIDDVAQECATVLMELVAAQDACAWHSWATDKPWAPKGYWKVAARRLDAAWDAARSMCDRLEKQNG